MGQVTAAVDFGTSHTVAVVSGPGLPARLVTVDGQPWFPSAVFWTGRGDAVVGSDALRLARTEPARLEPRPKSRAAEPEVLLGDAVVPTTVLVRAVLARVVAEASRTAGSPVQHLVLTHPANWGSTRIGALLAAAQGLAPRLSTVSEPVAAAAWFAGQHEFPVGASLGVLDFGGGTCDAAVIRREPAGFTVAGCAGLPDLGGDDLDQRIVDWIRADEPVLADLLDDQQRLRPEQMAALLRFREDVRTAKEVLSRHPQAEIALPEGLPDRLLTRAEFERLVGAHLSRAVELLTGVVTGCGLAPGDLLAVHLVGGSSQVPLLGSLLTRATGTHVRLDDTPQSVVALGGHAVTLAGHDGQATTPTAPPTEPVGTGHPVTPATPAGDPPARRWQWAAVAVLTVVALTLVTALSLGGNRTVAGEAQAAAGTTERLTLPPPAEGEPIAVAGRSTQRLPVAAQGQTVTYDDGVSAMTWRLDAFVDSAEQSEELARAGVRTDDAHRLVLVRITVGAKTEEASPSEVEAETYVVDDRGLMIGAAENFRMPGCPERDGSKKLKPGEERQVCLAFRVARTTPITEVALATVSTRRPESSTPERLASGARVQVSGQRVDGAPQPVPGGALPLGVPHTFRSGDAPTSTADVAVVDLVRNPSAYFDSEPIGLPGSRGVLVRLAVRAPEDAESLPPLLVSLHDDRGTAIDEAASAIVTGQDCSPEHEIAGRSGVQQVCHLFAVPTGTPVRDVEISRYGTDETVWRLS
ncbi:Hsp70 family protein [Actinophytocola sp.]|uniref:Hsp70 family protein n=1 Tax=Actinophytocola sp. TaxID=1872138 RepID=UPI003D6C5D27